MDFWQTAGLSGLAGFAFLNLVFLYAFGKKRYDVIDSAWGMTFIVICLTSYNLSENTDVGLLALVMVIVWGLDFLVIFFLDLCGPRRKIRGT